MAVLDTDEGEKDTQSIDSIFIKHPDAQVGDVIHASGVAMDVVAEELRNMNKMKGMRALPNAITYSSMIKVLGNSDDILSALRMLEEAEVGSFSLLLL